MTKVKIEKGIPIPAKVWGSRKKRKTMRTYLDEMEVGDSFLWLKVGSLNQTARQLKPKKFTIRQVGSAFRIWRIA